MTTTKYTLIGLLLSTVLLAVYPASACDEPRLSLRMESQSVASNPDNTQDVVPLHIHVSGLTSGHVTLAVGGPNEGSAIILDEHFHEITSVDLNDLNKDLWVQGLMTSTNINDVQIVASLYDSSNVQRAWKQISTTVVGVTKMQFKLPGKSFQDVPDGDWIYVEKGTTVTFKALPDPAGATWPLGKPEWDGSSGASGSGETIDVTFSTASESMDDTTDVTATCGSYSISTNVVSWMDDASVQLVFDNDTSATFKAVVHYKAWTPDYDGDGRPDADGGTIYLDMVPDFDDASVLEPLVTYTTWQYENGVAIDVDYVIQTGINNPDPEDTECEELTLRAKDDNDLLCAYQPG